MMHQATTWSYRILAGIVLISAACSCFFLYRSLKQGIGVTPDSVEYIYAAQSFNNGEGFKSIHSAAKQEAWLTHFPPGMSILYGLVSKTAAIEDILQAASILNMLFFMLNGVLIYLLVLAGSKNKWLVIITGLFIFTSIDGFCIVQMLWSEPCFLFFALLSLYFMSRYTATGEIPPLLSAAILTAIACTIRYVGITLILSGCLIIICNKRQGSVRNLWHGLCFGSISSSLLLLWFARNYRVQHTVSDRSFSFHPMTSDYLHDFLHAIKSFFLQANTGEATSSIGVLLTLSLLFMIYRLCISDRSFLSTHSLARVLMLFGIVYILFLFTSNTFFDFTPLYYRILFLPFLCFFLVLIMRLSTGSPYNVSGVRKKAFVTLCAIYILLHLVAFRNFLSASPEPDGYLAKSWRSSETIAYLKHIPAGAIVYTPDPEPIYMITGRAVASINFIEHDYSLNKSCRQFIVYFRSGRICNGYSYANPSVKKFEKFRLIREFSDGKIYEIF